MRQRTNKILCLVLALLMALSLFACGKSNSPITIDENGNASWAPIEGAVQYEYNIVDAYYVSLSSAFTTETTALLPEGKSIHIRPVFADGSVGDWTTSDYFGTPSVWTEEQLSSWDAESMADIPVVTIGADGYASWDPMEGAVSYECEFSDAVYVMYGERISTVETTVRVPQGCRVNVRAVFADGTVGDWISSDLFGEGLEEYQLGDYVDSRFDLLWSDVKSWKLIENIDYSTVSQTSDGGVTFSATAPDGSEMRFVGTEGVTVSEGAITFACGSRLTALDSIGRICAYEPVVSDFGEGRVDVILRGGYTFNGATSVDSVDDLFSVWGVGGTTEDYKNGSFPSPMMDHQPNMIGIGAGNYLEQDDYTISELIVYYDEATYATPIGELRLNIDFYGTYLEGEIYDAAKETYDSSAGNYTFYLMVLPKLLNERNPLPDFIIRPDLYLARAVIDLPQSRYTIGNLKDADGNILDKFSGKVNVGSTLEITLAGSTYDLELPVLARYDGAQTLNELSPYSNRLPTGDVTTLVVPIRWSDLPDEANDGVIDLARTKLGRVVDDSGNVTDYSPDPSEGYSLSAYYDIASHGKHHIESYITDWVDAPYTFEEKREANPVDDDMADKIITIVRTMYPNMDWSRFDRNSDGILDSVIFISASGDQELAMFSYGGAAHHSRGYTDDHAGTPYNPNMKDFISIGTGMLDSKNVVIHEYAHSFGIIDYYDVTYSGIDAVGGYDMQSQSVGDWNAYSKYAVGWIEPEVVTGLESGESVDITVGVMGETGDAIVIPAAESEFDGPFGEYIMVDLFADSGINKYDAEYYGLAGVTGVRIYHVNANMEHRTLTNMYYDEFDIGTVHYANDEKPSGLYHIELLQKGGDNTFTDLSGTITNVSPADFFYEGDSFDAGNYGEFLRNGKMDDGSEFGYTIQVVSITGSGADATAVIRITRK